MRALPQDNLAWVTLNYENLKQFLRSLATQINRETEESQREGGRGVQEEINQRIYVYIYA